MVDQPNNRSTPAPNANGLGSTGGALRSIVRAGPTLLVLAGLAALAYWGHHTGWRLPSFAALTGRESQEAADDWCEEHGVPESECVECQPDLLPKKEFGWCKAHGVPNCPLEHPEIAQLPVPARITSADTERARRALQFAPRPENNSKCNLYRRRIQFPSAEAADRAGVDIAAVAEEPMRESLSANAEVRYDQTKVAHLSARSPGSLWWVPKRVGDPVRRGEILALVDAADVGKAKAEFLQAIVQADLKETLRARTRQASASVPERQLHEVEASAREAQIRLVTAEQALVNLGLPIQTADVKGLDAEQMRRHLQLLGLPAELHEKLNAQTTTANLLPITAPLDGFVVAREAVAGEVVDPSKTLFVIADWRHMWVTLNLRQEDAEKVALRQPVRFHADGATTDSQGTVSWISTAVDEKTRTFKVRVDVANPDGRLRAGMFGHGQVVLREEPKAIVVPSEAVHSDGDCSVVFVRDKNYLAEGAPKVFHVRTVRVGVKDAQHTEIIAGVLPGEYVATKGSGVLLAELLKNNTGEG